MRLTRREVMLGTASFAMLAGRAEAGGVRVAGGFAFGSSWRIALAEGEDIAALGPGIEGVIREVDAQMSPYGTDSDLTRFNRSRTTDPQAMPGALCHVAAQSLEAARRTDGYFDPTVGPLVARWGFGPISGGIGTYRSIEVSATTLRKSVPDLTLDLCGIAKGYALDRIIETLVRSDVQNAVVELGGEVRALGSHPEGRPWRVAIADPWAREAGAWCVVAPGAYALATSGHAANGVSGRLDASHIIDPHSGRPASPKLASVSVLADSASEADALATALCSAGPENGVALARCLNVSALFLLAGTSGPVEQMTGGFDRHVLA